MHEKPLQSSRSTGRPAVIAPVTRTMVHARTREIALLAGRTPPHVLQSDYEQAKRELTGVSDPERQDAILDSHAAVVSGEWTR